MMSVVSMTADFSTYPIRYEKVHASRKCDSDRQYWWDEWRWMDEWKKALGNQTDKQKALVLKAPDFDICIAILHCICINIVINIYYWEQGITSLYYFYYYYYYY